MRGPRRPRLGRRRLIALVLLAPPLLWLGIVYLGSLFALLLQSFFSIDDFSGLINYEFTLATYRQLLSETNLDIILRTVLMATYDCPPPAYSASRAIRNQCAVACSSQS